MKKALGRREESDYDALARVQFNQKLRSEYAKDPVFDLERIESTSPQGVVCSFQLEGTTVPTFVEEYSYDGRHLNETGRNAVAKELLALLASLLR